MIEVICSLWIICSIIVIGCLGTIDVMSKKYEPGKKRMKISAVALGALCGPLSLGIAIGGVVYYTKTQLKK